MAVTDRRTADSPPNVSRGCRNTPLRIGDVVRDGMHVCTVTDVGTMLIAIKTSTGTPRMVCPWEIVRLRGSHDGHRFDSALMRDTTVR